MSADLFRDGLRSTDTIRDVTPFTFGDQQVRVLLVDGEPWWVLSDVCAALGLARGAAQVVERLSDDVRQAYPIPDRLGREQMTTIVSEPGLYETVIRSEAARAADFRRWVTHDVLPSIRRTGSYSVAPQRELSRLELIELALDSERARLAAESRVAELEPHAAFAVAAIEADGRDFSLREAAQILDRDPAISTGQNRLHTFLRSEARWIDSQGQPYQRHVDCGRVVAKVQTYKHPHTGEVTVARPQLRVTVKGLAELHKLMGGTGTLTAITAVAS